MNKWSQFSERMGSRYYSEAELEGRFIDCLFFILGWEPENDIHRQVPIQFGHEQKRADVILSKDGGDVVVIELKKQSVEIHNHELGQLFSYMRQKYCSYGLLVGDMISLYHDPRNGDDPRRVMSISFKDRLNPDGEKLMELLTKMTYKQDVLDEFCIDYAKELDKTRAAASVDNDVTANIDNLANYSSRGADIANKIDGLVNLYDEWLNEAHTGSQRETDYLNNLHDNSEWIRTNIIYEVLESLRPGQFVDKFREMSKRIMNQKRFLLMRFVDDAKILSIRPEFERSIQHLASAHTSDRFTLLNDFIEEGQYVAKGLGKGFWSELIRIQFPDVPLFNDKTERFFSAIGIYTGDTYEEKLMNISAFYSRLSKKYPDMTFEKLSHLEHFATAKNAQNDKGLEYMRTVFGINDELITAL
jgi:hypothetical protein